MSGRRIRPSSPRRDSRNNRSPILLGRAPVRCKPVDGPDYPDVVIPTELIPTTGWFNLMPPADPKNAASP
jgi:hypothetical protein